MLKCNLYNKYYKRIDSVHLPKKHSITVDTYLEQFPEADVISKDTIADYNVGGRWYDAFIPSKNLLVEFDGDFWHPKTLNECQYEFQIRNYYNDQKKNKIAIENGFDLIRIRQSESNKITGI